LIVLLVVTVMSPVTMAIEATQGLEDV